MVYVKELSEEELVQELETENQERKKLIKKEIERRTDKKREEFLNHPEKKFIYKLRHDGETGEIFYRGLNDEIPLIKLAFNKDNEIKSRSLIIFNVIAALKECYHFKTIGDVKKDVYVYHKGHYINSGEDLIKKCMQRGLGVYVRNMHVNEVLNGIIRDTCIDVDDMDVKNPNLICLENGIYDLKEKKLLPHSPDYNFIQQMPIKYNKESKCPAFFKFLQSVIEQDDLPCMQEYLGYGLYRKYAFKKAMILLGARDTGKTTLLNIVYSLYGRPNISGVSLQSISKNKFARAFLYGKLLNVVDDLSSEDVNSTGEFKMATGGGSLDAEVKFKDQFSFHNYAKHIFATNKIMGVKDSDDEAFFSRWLIIPFNNQFLGKDAIKDFASTISTDEEKSGILNWMIEGYNRLINNNDFNYTRSADENQAIMERSSSSIVYYIQDCLEGGKWDDWISKEDMYNTYRAFVKSNGGYCESKEKFGRELPNKADWLNSGKKDTEKQKGVTGWRNVKLSEKGQHTFHTFSHFVYNNTNNNNNIKILDNKSKNSMQSMKTCKNCDLLLNEENRSKTDLEVCRFCLNE